jgi:telomere length regulation protein
MLVAEIVSQMTVTETEEQRREREQRNAKQNGNKRRKIDPGVDGKATADFEKLMGGLDIDEDGQQTNSAPTAADVPPKMKRLDFGSSMWEGTGEGKEECRYLRAFVGLKDSRADLKNGNEALLGWASSGQSASLSSETADDPMQRASSKATKPEGVREDSRSRSSGSRPSVINTIDSDDESLVGYSSTSSQSSSRSPSPTPSYLEEIAQDPMLNMRTREKVERPVYIGQLIDLLKAREEPDKLEVGLKWGESLVRRKRDFGRELGK